MEAEQAENPSAFIPNGNSKHRQPQSTESYDVQAGSNKVRKKTTAKDKPTTTTNRKKKTCNPETEDGCLTENLALATEIIAQTPTNEETSQTPVQPLVPSGLAQYVESNPPVVINLVGRGIRKCKGCGEKITDAEQSYPNNMVFHRIGIWGKFLALQNKWIQKKYNMHFHLKFSCLCKNDSTVDMKDIVMNDDFFSKI